MEIMVSQEDFEEAERGNPVAGFYPVILDDAYEDQQKPGTDVLKWLVSSGKWRGHAVFVRFDDPSLLSSEDAQKAVSKKVRIWAVRMGLLQRGHVGPFTPRWVDRLGQPYVIQFANRKYEDPPKSGNWKEICDPKFDGFYEPWDERVPKELRSAPPANAAAATPVAATAPAVPATNGQNAAAVAAPPPIVASSRPNYDSLTEGL
jgi:hypothetical protein